MDWDGVLGGYEAALDWPACTFYEELMERNPGAKVVLSVRDPERWYESTRNTIYELSVGIPRSPLYRVGSALVSFFLFGQFARVDMAREIIWDGTFDGHFEDKQYAIEAFERHNEEVRRRVPPELLLIYEVKEGWGPLCQFLGVPEPEEPFPRLNDAARMRRVIWTIRTLSVAAPAVLALLGFAALALLRRRTRP